MLYITYIATVATNIPKLLLIFDKPKGGNHLLNVNWTYETGNIFKVNLTSGLNHLLKAEVLISISSHVDLQIKWITQ